MRWKPIYECKKQARSLATPVDKERWGGKITYVYTCSRCADRVPDKHGQVDHIVPCGSLVDIAADAGPFLVRMLVEVDGLRYLCNPCHHGVTHGQATAAP